MTAAAPLAARIKHSLQERPWLLDIGIGGWSIGWGLWVVSHRRQMLLHAGFDRFHHVIPAITTVAAVLGFAALWCALVKWRSPRRKIAGAAMILWGGLVFGVSAPSGQAAYTLPFMFNFLIFSGFY